MRLYNEEESIEELSDKHILESIESVTFRPEELPDYKEMFRELTRKGLIVKGDFEDHFVVNYRRIQ